MRLASFPRRVKKLSLALLLLQLPDRYEVKCDIPGVSKEALQARRSFKSLFVFLPVLATWVSLTARTCSQGLPFVCIVHLLIHDLKLQNTEHSREGDAPKESA